MWGLLSPFTPSSELYAHFLRLTGVRMMAVDRHRADRAFRQALTQQGIALLPQAGLLGAAREGGRLCVLQSRRYGTLGADLWIDASLGADLAHRALVGFRPGLGPRDLSRESIALGWVFEEQGLSLRDLQSLEEQITHRLLNPQDLEARGWLLDWQRQLGSRSLLPEGLVDDSGHPRLAYASTSDSADQRSPGLAIAFHGEERIPAGLWHSEALLDRANIAILPDRLSFNALLFRNTADQNRRVLAGGSRPLPEMEPVAAAISRFLTRHGARRVIWMPQLYVRSADQIAHPRETLSADRMARGGVERDQALGTFTYNLDLRGALARVTPSARPTFNFGYRHTLPKEYSNLAVLGPSSGYGGLGEGAGRIIELNISVGQGLAIASALALRQGLGLAAVNPRQVAALMPQSTLPYGRPSRSTMNQLMLRRLLYSLVRLLPQPLADGLWDKL